MDADDVERVVVAEPVLQADGQGAEHTGDDADGRCAPTVSTAAAAGVMATRPATTPDAAPRLVAWPSRSFSVDEPAEHGDAGGDGGVDPGLAGGAVGGELGEPALKPNQPNHSRAAPSITNGRLCGRIGSLPKPLRLPMIEREHEARHTGVDVDDRATGEVDRGSRASDPVARDARRRR